MHRLSASQYTTLTGAALSLLLAVGCSDDDKGTGPPAVSAVPDFSLQDVNPNSTTREQMVSPRQYEGKISAWYFGHAT